MDLVVAILAAQIVHTVAGRGPRREAMDVAVQTDHVEAAGSVHRERSDLVEVAAAHRQLGVAIDEVLRLAVGVTDGPEVAGDKVTEDVEPICSARAAIDIAARNREAVEQRGRTTIVQDRVGQPAGSLAREGQQTLLEPPAQIEATNACWNAVHFLACALAHITDPEVAGDAVETGPPGISEAVEPDLIGTRRGTSERISRRNRVVPVGVRRKAVAVHIDAQDLAQQGVQVLGVVLRIAARATITGGDVEKPVRSKPHPAAVVIAERLVVAQHHPPGPGIGMVGIGSAIFADLGVAAGVGQIDVEKAVGGVVRMKRQPQQALLAAAGQAGIWQVQIAVGVQLTGVKVQNADASGVLFDNEQAVRVPRRRRGEQGVGQARGYPRGVDDLGSSLKVRDRVAIDDIVARAAEHAVRAVPARQDICGGGPGQGIPRTRTHDIRHAALRPSSNPRA